MYNIGFTVTGKYSNITQFIYDIENDSKLGFKIEDFNMTPAESALNLQGKFSCKDVRIEISETSIGTINNSNTGIIAEQPQGPNETMTTDQNATNTTGQANTTQNTTDTSTPGSADTTSQNGSNTTLGNTSTEVTQ